MHKIFLAFWILLFSILGCQSNPEIIRLYQGAPQPKDQIAILRVTPDQHPEGFEKDEKNRLIVIPKLVAVDGIERSYDSFWHEGFEVHLLPGQHTLRISYVLPVNVHLKKRPEAIDQRDVEFQAEPGKVYTIHTTLDQGTQLHAEILSLSP